MQKVIDVLEQEKISFEIVGYSKDIKSALEASKEIGLNISQMLKTLLLKSSNNKYILILIPCDKKIDIETINEKLNDKFLLAPPSEVEEITGYKIGVVTPIYLETKLTIYVYSGVLKEDIISIGSGENGKEILISPKDLIKVTNAKLINIF